MDKLKSTKKITLATLKSFARRNNDRLYCKSLSDFNGMTDCVEHVNGDFKRTQITDEINYYRSGIQGVYTVGSSDDYFHIYEDESFFGITIFNCCGSSILAVRKEA